MKPKRNLTLRQRELLELWLQGETDKACADALGVKYSAVRKRAEGIFRKLGAHNKTEAAGRFLRLGDTGELASYLKHHLPQGAPQ